MDNLRKGANNIGMLPFALWILYGVAAITRPYDYMASTCYLMDVCGSRTVEVQESLPILVLPNRSLKRCGLSFHLFTEIFLNQ